MMKKLLRILPWLLCLMMLCSCALPFSSGPVPTETEVGTEYTAEGIASFCIQRVSTDRRVVPTGFEKDYFEQSKDGYTYVDAVLSYTNLRSEAVNPTDSLVMYAESPEGEVYSTGFRCVETNAGTGLSATENIAPSDTACLHCAFSVPENAGTLRLYIELGEQVFSYICDTARTDRAAESVKTEQKVTADGLLSFCIQDCAYEEYLMPTNTDVAHAYFEPGKNDIFLVADIIVVNEQKNSCTAESLMKINCLFPDGSSCSSMPLAENEDGSDFSPYYELEPGVETLFHFTFEVPETMLGSSADFIIGTGAGEYIFHME